VGGNAELSRLTYDDTERMLDFAALARWLVDRGEPVAGELQAKRIGLGQSNLTYGLSDAAGRRWVARRPPLGTLLASAHDVAREHRILVALAGTGVPAPSVIGLVDDPLVCDVPVLVVEYVDGLVIDRIEVAEGLLPNQLTAWLRTHVPEQSYLAVVHGDLHLRNVIADPVTCAALDWELCTLGDPLADLGSTLAYWPEAGDEPNGLFEAYRLPGFATRAEIAEAYAGGTGADLAALPFWEVLGPWKIAIIAEGVRRRVIDEPANAAEGGPPAAELIDGLVDRALERAGA
jgi:aminoglycoside phosphotransferase (APT) family kinase protein